MISGEGNTPDAPTVTYGKNDGKDATKLLQYLANYDPAAGESSVVLGPNG